MIIKNFTKNRLFTKEDLTNIYSFDDLKLEKINKQIYYSPMSYPYVNSFNCFLGSVFEKFIIPTDSYDPESNWEKIDTKLNVSDYEDWLYKEIKSNVSNAYSKNKQVNLLFSGGIDSLVVASFVLANNLENRTRFVIVHDQTQIDETALVNDISARKRIEKFVKRFNIQDCCQINLTVEDYVDVCNTESFEHLRCHSTSALFNRFNDEIFIGGHGGNWSLLHKEQMLDEILIKKPSLLPDLNSIILDDSIYCKTHKNYSFENLYFANIHFDRKRWELLSGNNQNELSLILATKSIYQQTRQIDWNSIDIATVSDAKLARRLIEKNVGNEFNEIISNENINDCDSFVSFDIELDRIKTDIFRIPTNLNHHEDGLYWWNHNLNSARQTGYINSNVIASFLALHQLSKEINT